MMMMIITVGSSDLNIRREARQRQTQEAESTSAAHARSAAGVPRDERRMSEADTRPHKGSEREFVTSQRNVGSERAGQEMLTG